MKIKRTELMNWLNATELKKIGNKVFIKFDYKMNEFECELMENTYGCKILNEEEVIMPKSEFIMLLEVYKSSQVRWN